MTSMAPEAPDFPEPFAAVHQRLASSLDELRRLRAVPSDDVPESERSLTSWVREVRQGAQGLKVCGQASLAWVLEGCAAACERLQAVPALQGQDALEAIERALVAVLQHADHPLPDAVSLAVELFPLHRAVQHLAGADRVHPADLWPGCPEWRELAADPFTSPRAVDAGAREALEAALLALMRQPRAEDFQRMSELCAALGEGTAPPQASVWKLASAVYEAQAEGRLSPDVYLKRLGPRLLAMTRAASPVSVAPGRSVLEPLAPTSGAGQLSEPVRMLAHELLFFCHRALAAGSAEGSPMGPRLARFAAAYGTPEALPAELTAEAAPPEPEAAVSEDVLPEAFPPEPVPPEAVPPEALTSGALTPEAVPRQPSSSAAQRSLADAVPGLPSAADLDFSSWTMAANADVAAVPDDEVKVIGPLRLEIPAFNAFLNDADEASRLLATLLAEWALEPAEPVPEEAVAQAKVLARGAAQVGHGALAALAEALAQALHITAAAVWPPSGTLSGNLSLPSSLTPSLTPAWTPAWTPGLTPTDTAARLIGAAEEIRRVLHQFAAGFLTEPAPRVLEGLAEISSVAPPPAGPVDLRYLQQLGLLQKSITQALDTLGNCRPSAAAAAQDPAEADQAFEAALAAAVAGVKASQHLLASALGHSGDSPA